MAVKAQKPKYQCPYKDVFVKETIEGEEVSYPVQVLNDDEVTHQAAIRLECVKRTHGNYTERTLNSHAKRHEKLFLASTEEEVVKEVISSTGASMTEFFKYRSFADILEEKKHLIVNEDYKKLVDFAIESLRTYGCIHPKVKAILQILQKN
jgi:hypothetical protein